MTERVQQLINNLMFHKDSLWYACRQLGFDEGDLTAEERETLDGAIFQCGYCERWEPADECFHDYEFGWICGTCREELNAPVA